MNRTLLFLLLPLLALGTVVLNVCSGSVSIPLSQLSDERWHYIVWHSRLPSAITAVLTGGSLGVCGLLLQSYFRNPLAGPSILGITSGAQLMVALVIVGGSIGAPSRSLLVSAAIVGAGSVMCTLLAVGRWLRQPATLLIVGLLISYLISAMITLLGYHATAQGVQQLMVWGMGDFGSVGSDGLLPYILLNVSGWAGAIALTKSMNGWMLGHDYARALGIHTGHTQMGVLAVTGLLAAVTTAWCGPIAFVGMSVPHVARLLLRTDDHRHLLPASLLLGALCCGLCLWLSTRPQGGTLLPINALTPLFGIPVILLVLLRK